METKFKYGEKVRVISGFYKGTTGIAIRRMIEKRGFFNKTTIVLYAISYQNAENPSVLEADYFSEDALEKA